MTFWAEALATATHLINRRSCRATGTIIPFKLLFDMPPTYNELCVFGCCSFPILTPTTRHKLEARSAPCIFIGYPADHRGYRCFDVTTRCVLTS